MCCTIDLNMKDKQKAYKRRQFFLECGNPVCAVGRSFLACSNRGLFFLCSFPECRGCSQSSARKHSPRRWHASGACTAGILPGTVQLARILASPAALSQESTHQGMCTVPLGAAQSHNRKAFFIFIFFPQYFGFSVGCCLSS